MPAINRRSILGGGAMMSALALSDGVTRASKARPFSFCVLGDTCYDIARDYPAYMALIDAINAAAPDFTIHVGDTKGAGSCGEAFQRRVYQDFQRFQHPLIYTPGDNEWVDWFLDVNGNGPPLEALALIREIFFSQPRSLGQPPMSVVRQADVSQHRQMVENLLWTHQGVTFGTVHIPGTNNGYSIDGRTPSAEFPVRNAANLDWVDAVFDAANSIQSIAVVLAFHADWFRPIDDEPNAFVEIDAKISDRALTFGKPVLLLHGDLHIFVIDRPYHRKAGGAWGTGYNVLRLQPHGAPELKAVNVTIDPDAVDPFSFRTISIPQVHRL